MVQWLKLHTLTAATTGSIPRWGTKILHAMQCSQKKKNQRLRSYREPLLNPISRI